MRMSKSRNQREKIGNGTVVSIVLISIFLFSLVITPVSAAKLATPIVTYPPNNFHTYFSFGIQTFTWKPVPGAVDYLVRIYKKSGTDWLLQEYGTPNCAYYQNTNMWNSGLTYRWSVVARNGNIAEDSTPSAWRTFDYKIGGAGVKLAKPVPVGPSSGTIFYHTPRVITFNWKPVIGADRYSLLIQYYDQGSKSWQICPSTPINLGGTLATMTTYTFNGPLKGRWCVIAQDSTGCWLESPSSAWQTFEFKN